MNIPRILIAAPASGEGKTTVTTGIMAALRRRGLRVQGFKVGPDFIDPTFHRAATGRASYNLDGWMLSREVNTELCARASADADVVVIEGVMGLFDGKNPPSLAGTTAEIAMWLDAAVTLVLDASAMAGSAAAIVHGFDTLIPELPVAAVICNKVAGEKHYGYLRDAITARCRPELLGYLPLDSNITIPDRHLGLHMAEETCTPERLLRMSEWIESHIDLDRLLELSNRPRVAGLARNAPPQPVKIARIGIARDAAFCFYYESNLEALRLCGAELVEFSPIGDAGLPPDLDGIYLGGGYPELHAAALSGNFSMRRSVQEFAGSGAPVYTECGGFMYLCDAIVDADGNRWPMAGVFPTCSRMQKRLAKLGYIEVESCESDGWLAPGERARGHEFRYSTMDRMPESIARVYREPAEGYRMGGVIGSYIHLHFLSCPAFAERFVQTCARALTTKLISR
jgi:cobyrinic acid a,c-diamide synthase